MPSLLNRPSLRRYRSHTPQSSRRSRYVRTIEPLEHRLVFAAVQDWSIRGVGGGGALFSPSFNPTNTSEMYIASDMGQLFRTTNEGALWETVDHSELHGGHNSEVQFTTDPLVRYSLSYGDSGDYGSPTKSTDGGATWTPIAADPTGGETFSIVADYNNPNRVLISDYTRLYVSNNGGTSFTLRYTTASGDGLHIAGAFFDGNNIYVGTNQGVLLSTNGGTSNFSLASYVIPSSQQILSFAGAKSGSTTRLWAVTGPSGSVYAGIQGYDFDYAGVYRIDVGQASWTSMNSGLPASAKPYAVAAALNDINNVYLGGGDTSNGHPRVYRSTVGGGSWQSVMLTSNNANVQTGWSGTGGVRDWSYGEFALGLAVAPLDFTRILITDLGFAHYSEDSGGSWRSLNVAPDDLNPAGAPIPANQTYKSSGLENTTSWNLTWTSSSHIIGSFSDIRGAVSHDTGTSWSFNYTGHTQNSMYRSIVHPTTGVVYAATSTVHDMYQSTYLTDARIDGGDGHVLFSTNGGDTWQLMRDFNRVVVWVEADPTNPNRLYAAVAHSADGGIYVTNNASAGAASTWTKLANPPRTQGHAFNIRVLSDGTLVASYSGRRDGGGAFTASSGVFVSTDGGTSWADRSHSGMQYWTKDVVIDPHDATQSTWYATVFSGWGGAPNGLGGVYRTTNRGQSWTRINALDRVNSITISPTNPNEAYITTETEGLWYTENFNAATPTVTEVDGYHFLHPTRVFYNPHNANEIWVTSFGGGLRVGTTNAPPTPGDFDGDHDVDGADFVAWQTNFPKASGATRAQGDADGDGDVDGADFVVWQTNFPTSPGSAIAAGSAFASNSSAAASSAPAAEHASASSDPAATDEVFGNHFSTESLPLPAAVAPSNSGKAKPSHTAPAFAVPHTFLLLAVPNDSTRSVGSNGVAPHVRKATTEIFPARRGRIAYTVNTVDDFAAAPSRATEINMQAEVEATEATARNAFWARFADIRGRSPLQP
jgi:hypothetical protein